eukprot:gene4293-6088_t
MSAFFDIKNSKLLHRDAEPIELLISTDGFYQTNIPMTSSSMIFVAVYQAEGHQNLKLIGLSDPVAATGSLAWSPIIIHFILQHVQKCHVKIFLQRPGVPVTFNGFSSKHALLGETNFLLSTLVTSKKCTLTLDAKLGTEIVSVLTIRGFAKQKPFFVTRNIRAENLESKSKFNLWVAHHPFYVISRVDPDGEIVEVFRSNPVVVNTLQPFWGSLDIPLAVICGLQTKQSTVLKIDIFNMSDSKEIKSMGSVETTIEAIIGMGSSGFPIIKQHKKNKDGYDNSGKLYFDNSSIDYRHTVAEYIAGGCELSLVVAIDFTGSNGDYSEPTSLHHFNPKSTTNNDMESMNDKNEYQKAIISVGRILEPYDTDKSYPVYGFGAKVANIDGTYSEDIQHDFPLIADQPEVIGVAGILKAYNEVVTEVLPQGETKFAPIIEVAAEKAKSSRRIQNDQHYTILLMLTDGILSDIEATKRAIIEASHQPLSIVIVGVGEEDFSKNQALIELDGDNQALKLDERIAVRDIVQVVPFKAAMQHGAEALAEEVLQEIPTAILKFMASNSILPRIIS